jgi:hypothetical protein
MKEEAPMTTGISRICRLFLILFILTLFTCCGGGGGGGGSDNTAPEEITGDAILDIQLVDGGHPWLSDGTPPEPPAGYALLDYDLNEGSGGNYIWLYYKVGKADGSEGDPLSSIYTVCERDNEDAHGGTQLPVNLSNNSQSPNEPVLWLYCTRAKWPVVRCIVVYNYQEDVIKYAPPEAEGKYKIVWVQDQTSDHMGFTNDTLGLTADAQDLNEHELCEDYIFLGYGVD